MSKSEARGSKLQARTPHRNAPLELLERDVHAGRVQSFQRGFDSRLPDGVFDPAVLDSGVAEQAEIGVPRTVVNAVPHDSKERIGSSSQLCLDGASRLVEGQRGIQKPWQPREIAGEHLQVVYHYALTAPLRAVVTAPISWDQTHERPVPEQEQDQNRELDEHQTDPHFDEVQGPEVAERKPCD